MPVYLAPGVYIEEIPSGSRPIEGVSTSTAAFVGAARMGPSGEAVLIHSLDQYRSLYGAIASRDDAMGLAVQAFYMQGGKSAYVCRLVGDDPASRAASISVAGEDAADVLTIRASSVGEWGNDVYIRIVKPDQDALTFTLEVGHREGDKLVVDESFTGLTMDALDDRYALTQVNGSSRYVELALGSGAAAAFQDAELTGGTVTGFGDSLSSGSWKLNLSINGMGAKQISVSAADFVGTDPANGDHVAQVITDKVRELGTDDAYQTFESSFAGNRFTLTSLRADAADESSASVEVYDGAGGAGDLARLLRLDSKARATLQGGLFTSPAADAIKAAVDAVGAVPLTLDIAIDDHDAVSVTLDPKALKLRGDSHEADGQALARAIQNAVRAAAPGVPSYTDFTLDYQIVGADARFVLTSGSSASRTSALPPLTGSLASALRLNGGAATAAVGREYDDGTAPVVPQEDLGALELGVPLEGGGEVEATAAELATFLDNVLRKRRDVSILLLPGQTWSEDNTGNPYISAALAHCEATKSRMLIIDPPHGVELAQAADVDEMGLPTSTYAVMYYPWVKIANPLYNEDRDPPSARTLDIAPSSFGAGMWAKIDANRGVWKAPAGVETQLTGAAGLQYSVEEGEQEQLNPLGVNCIRKLPGFGQVIWGARTLATRANPEWRYVPVRRTAIYIERSIYEGIQWAVFEPNDHPLWSSLRANIESFMNGLFRSGAFQGAKASDAYFVRCGLGDTMTQADIDRGQVIVIVGFAPLKPAEFVIVRIQQKVGQQ